MKMGSVIVRHKEGGYFPKPEMKNLRPFVFRITAEINGFAGQQVVMHRIYQDGTEELVTDLSPESMLYHLATGWWEIQKEKVEKAWYYYDT